MARLLQNKAQCLICGSVIESRHQHDLVYCVCRSIAVDGGPLYARRIGEPQHIKDLCIWEDEAILLASLSVLEAIEHFILAYIERREQTQTEEKDEGTEL